MCPPFCAQREGASARTRTGDASTVQDSDRDPVTDTNEVTQPAQRSPSTTLAECTHRQRLDDLDNVLLLQRHAVHVQDVRDGAKQSPLGGIVGGERVHICVPVLRLAYGITPKVECFKARALHQHRGKAEVVSDSVVLQIANHEVREPVGTHILDVGGLDHKRLCNATRE